MKRLILKSFVIRCRLICALLKEIMRVSLANEGAYIRVLEILFNIPIM